MRLPTKGNNVKIDVEKASNLLDHALDQGINYLDTAYPYHGISTSSGETVKYFLESTFLKAASVKRFI